MVEVEERRQRWSMYYGRGRRMNKGGRRIMVEVEERRQRWSMQMRRKKEDQMNDGDHSTHQSNGGDLFGS